MRTVGLGIQSFEKIRSNNQFYVDKTAFIGAWVRKNDDITLITRPRRFGKTLTVDMLNCFFSRTYEGRSALFDGLEVFRIRRSCSCRERFRRSSFRLPG
ncbi:MAG: AAA family ATPase [Lachnospiraceae bacterium]|nr:AAA family ATPase [Lachnospiraceae bacterium]